MAKPNTVVAPRVAADVLVDIGSVAAGDSLDVTATVKGLKKGGPVILWTEGALDDGLVCGNAHASDNNELTFRVVNATGGPVNPAELTFRVVQF